MSSASDVLALRPAVLTDLGALEELEFDCFDSDRFSRRRWRYLLTQAHAVTLVLEDLQAVHDDERLQGYAMVLLRTHSRRALLHSLCVHPQVRRHGQAMRLLAACEAQAVAAGADTLWLDVHVDNHAALRLYQRCGYHRYSWEDDVYEDGGAAWRMEKHLAHVTA